MCSNTQQTKKAGAAQHWAGSRVAHETTILLHPPLPLVGVSIVMETSKMSAKWQKSRRAHVSQPSSLFTSRQQFGHVLQFAAFHSCGMHQTLVNTQHQSIWMPS